MGARGFNGAGKAGNATTIVAEVDPAKVESLRRMLDRDGDPRASRVVDLSRSEHTHFARWVLVASPSTAKPWLVFESNHDGRIEEYLDEILDIGGAALVTMYEHCVGAPSSGELKSYLLDRRRVLGYEAFYRAYPTRSVAEVKTALAITNRVRKFLDDGRAKLAGLPPNRIHEQVQRVLLTEGYKPRQTSEVLSLPQWLIIVALVALVLLPFVALGVREWLDGVSLAHVTLYLILAVIGAFIAIVVVVRVVEHVPPPVAPQVPLAAENELCAQEDFAAQNQLTHVSIIKAGRIRMLLLRLVLSVINLLARVTFTRGELGTIASIHFARWVILPDRRLLFMSNFDGSWDSYLGDFIEKANTGLTGIWSNTEYFPKTTLLVFGGASAGHAFKVWTRAGQIPTQIWYTAYPGATVPNIRNALALWADVFRPASEPNCGAWLAAFR
jgi:hypothetical protein